MSSRPHLPKLPTAEGATGRNNNSHRPSVHTNRSPSDSALRPQPTAASSNLQSFSMNPKKRRTGPSSRGNSPPDKRSKALGSTGDIPDKYASPKSPGGPNIFPQSRQNSVSGISIAPSGPAAMTNHGRRSDSYRPDNRVDADSRPVQSGMRSNPDNGALLRKPSVDGRSPLLTMMSPMSMHGEGGVSGSGASTPVRIAPPAPSMIPSAPVVTATTASPASSGKLLRVVTSVVNALDAQQHQKRLHGHGTSTAPVGLASLRALKARNIEEGQKALQEATAALTRDSGMNQLPRPGASNPATTQPNQHPTAVARETDIISLQSEQSTLAQQVDKLVGKEKSREAHVQQLIQEQARAAVEQQMGAINVKVQETMKAALKTEMAVSEQRIMAIVDSNFEEQEKKLVKAAHDSSTAMLAEIETVKVKVDKVVDDESATYGIANKLKKKDMPEAYDKIKRLETEVADIKKELDKEASDKIKKLATKVADMKKELDKVASSAGQSIVAQTTADSLRTRVETVEQKIDSLEQDTAASLRARTGTIEQKIVSLEQDTDARIKVVVIDIEKLNTDLEVVETNFNVTKSDVDTLKVQVPSFITESIKNSGDLIERNLKAEIERHSKGESVRSPDPEMKRSLEAINTELASHSTDIVQLKQHPTLTANHPVVVHLQEQLIHLVSAVEQRPDQQALNMAIQLVRNEIQNGLGSRILSEDRIMIGINNLEDRYNNISTDAIYGQMVHWWHQNYPDAFALVTSLNTAQADINDLQAGAAKIQTSLQRIQKLEENWNAGAAEQARRAEAKADRNQELIGNVQTAVDTLSNDCVKRVNFETEQAIFQQQIDNERSQRTAAIEMVETRANSMEKSMDHWENFTAKTVAAIKSVNQNADHPLVFGDFLDQVQDKEGQDKDGQIKE